MIGPVLVFTNPKSKTQLIRSSDLPVRVRRLAQQLTTLERVHPAGFEVVEDLISSMFAELRRQQRT